jgi:hypothetical protein
MSTHTFLIALLAAFPALAAGPAEHGIPLFFVANGGQASPEVRFMAKGSGLTAYFLKDEAVFQTFGSSIRMHLEGANPGVRIEGSNPLAGRVNFFTGGEENWHAGLPMYGAVAYRDLYAGIDMVYGGSGRNLKSEFLVAPGADPSQIRVRYLGASDVRIDGDGALAIAVNGEILHERAPEIYQDRGGKRVAVKGRFQAGADGAFGFAIGGYDRSLPLVIDPVVSYSTLLGGSGADAADALAVDSTGRRGCRRVYGILRSAHAESGAIGEWRRKRRVRGQAEFGGQCAGLLHVSGRNGRRPGFRHRRGFHRRGLRDGMDPVCQLSRA